MAPSSENTLPQPRSDPLVSCTTTPWSYSTHIRWLRRRTSTVAASRTTLPTERLRTGHPVLLFALFISYFDSFDAMKSNGFGMKKSKKQNGVIGSSATSFCYLTNETRLFFRSAFRLFLFVPSIYFFDNLFSFGLAPIESLIDLDRISLNPDSDTINDMRGGNTNIPVIVHSNEARTCFYIDISTPHTHVEPDCYDSPLTLSTGD